MSTAVAAAPPAAVEQRLGVRELLAFIGMTMGMFIAVLNIQIVGSSFAEIQAGLSAGPEEISWVITASLIAEVIMIPLSGWLSRLLSTRWLFTICCLSFAGASLACAAATSIEMMIVFRALQGFSGGAMAPMVFATVFAAFPERYQTPLIALVSLLGTAAMALGPTLGGWISDALSWHWLFLVLIPFALLAAFLVFTLVNFDRPEWNLARHIDLPGIALLATFFLCLLVVLEEGRRADWFDSDMIVTLSAITLVAGILLVWRELTCAHPVIDLRVFTNRNFAVGAFYITVFGAGLYVPLYLLPLFLGRIIGMETWQIGSWLFVLGLSMMVAGFVVPTMLRYFRRRTVAFVGFTLLAIGNWTQADLHVDTNFVELLAPQLLRGFATQMCFLAMINLGVGLLPVDQVKNGMALFQLVMRLGAAIGVAIANSYLVIRSQINYHQFREIVIQGHHYADQTFGALVGRGTASLGDSPQAAAANLQLLIKLSQRDALIQAFNEITMTAAIVVGLALLAMPLVQSVRERAEA